MNGNAELLNFIYQNSQMGVKTLEQLIGIVEDQEFKRHLESQLEEYQVINQKAKALLNKEGKEEKAINTLDKVKAYLMINIQTMTDKSTSHVAEMLIIGSNRGVIDAIKNIRRYQDVKPEIVHLMEKLLSIEEANISQLKKFL